MKLQKGLRFITCVVAILLALPISASAIGFNAEETYQSVFVVTSGNSLGSGFAVGENCIVTNAHVLDNPNNIHLTTYSGETYSAYLVDMDQQKDIAVLGVKDVKFTPLKIADYAALNTGDDAYAIGAPKSMAYTLTKGVISAKERKIRGHTYIQTDAAINEGNSGGPLMNEEGNVIGINTLKMSDSEGIGLAIPMSVVSEFIESLNIKTDENGNVSEPITQNIIEDENPTEDVPEQDETDERASKKTPGYIRVLIAALCVSFALNIMFMIKLSSYKRKYGNVQYDPTERTDFDIEILE